MTCDSHVTTYLTCKLEELDFGNSKPTMDDVAVATVLVPRERISSSKNKSKSKEAYFIKGYRRCYHGASYLSVLLCSVLWLLLVTVLITHVVTSPS